MANNRMVLICKACKKVKAVAKYYPSQGWYRVENEKSFSAFIEEHSKCNEEDGTMLGGEPFELCYESDNKDWKYN